MAFRSNTHRAQDAADTARPIPAVGLFGRRTARPEIRPDAARAPQFDEPRLEAA